MKGSMQEYEGTRTMRRTARWGKDRPIEPETAEGLVKVLSAIYGPTKVRLAVMVLTGSIEKVIDNEDDAQETLRRIREKRERPL